MLELEPLLQPELVLVLQELGPLPELVLQELGPLPELVLHQHQLRLQQRPEVLRPEVLPSETLVPPETMQQLQLKECERR